MALPRSIIGGLANTTAGKRVTADLLLNEQRAKLDAPGQSGAVDQATPTKVIQAAYGL